jgi:hypothetical protein
MSNEILTVAAIVCLTILECYAMSQGKGDASTYLIIVGLIAALGGYHAGKTVEGENCQQLVEEAHTVQKAIEEARAVENTIGKN